MGLEVLPHKEAKTAKNTIDGFDIQYSFEHIPGEAPDVVRARGTIEGSKTVLDSTYFPATGNYNTTFHYLTDEVDVKVVSNVLTDMKALVSSIQP